MQVPAPFEYERATSVDHALELLRRLGPEARILAGGHSLLPMMKLRLASPGYLIDIDGLADELGYIRVQDGEIRIGAMTRHRALLESALLARRTAIFTDAERVIADPIVRNRGTIGGALCQADPAEDLGAVCSAIGARTVIRGPEGDRFLDIDDFHRGPYQTAVGDDEMLTEIRVPLPADGAGCGSAYEKVARRVGDWAVAAAGASLSLDEDGVVAQAGVALAAVGSGIACAEARAELIGHAPTSEVLERAGAAAAAACAPMGDQRGSAKYKRHVAGVLTTRALTRAVARAQATAGTVG
ncbi:MAG TPA: xanthine dehydrogenase family protein subunit M [Solirubrobacteraceae bacterium]